LAVALGACADDSPAGPGSQTGIVDLGGGVKRVTLTGNYVADLEGQGWDLAAARITPDPVGSDFHLRATMVVQLTYNEQPAGFCKQSPVGGGVTFASLDDIPVDSAGCNWTSAQLGGNFEHSDSSWTGQGYLFRDRSGAVVAKLRIVSDYVIGPDVGVTFDIVGL
jgi:hypothetical protein